MAILLWIHIWDLSNMCLSKSWWYLFCSFVIWNLACFDRNNRKFLLFFSWFPFDSFRSFSSLFFIHDFGTVILKTSCRKTLGKHISKLIISGNVFKLDITVKHLLTNKMVIYLDMFRSGVEDYIRGYSQGRDIVTRKLRWCG